MRVEARWPLESCADASSGHLSSRSGWFYIRPWKDSSTTLCRFGLEDYRLSRRALITPSPNSFGEIIDFFYAKILIYDFLCSFSYICLCRSQRIALKYKSGNWRCLDARIGNLGFIKWQGCLGRRQSKEGAKTAARRPVPFDIKTNEVVTRSYQASPVRLEQARKSCRTRTGKTWRLRPWKVCASKQ